MNATESIDTLLLEVQKLREQVRPATRDEEFKAMEERLRIATWKKEEAEKARDAAIAELEKLKADVAWTMKKLLIKDLIFLRGSQITCAGEGWLPLHLDPKDTERIEWLNSHARLGAGDAHWLVSIPHSLDLFTTELPTPYNIRHIIDLSIVLDAEERKSDAPAM